MNWLYVTIRDYQSYGLLAFVLTVFATPVAMRIAQRFGVMDMPDRKLKPHARPTPYLGGTAICLGWAVAVAAAIVEGLVEWHFMVPLLLGGVTISAIGLLDDVLDISPRLRLGLNAAVIAFVLMITGVGSRFTDCLLGPIGIDVPPIVATPVSVLISIFVVLGACNSANLIDGLDGLCSGVTAIISLGFFLLAAHLASWDRTQHEDDPARLVLAIALFGATMGFLPLNFNPARIFMGDAGSMLLGYNCGMLIVLFAEWGWLRWVLGGIMVFALPITDTALAMYRRWRCGRSIFAGDRSHFYDQLVDRGIPVRKVVAISYALTAFFALMGCMPIWLRTRYTIVLYTVIGIAIVLVIWAARMVRADDLSTAPASPTAADEA